MSSTGEPTTRRAALGAMTALGAVAFSAVTGSEVRAETKAKTFVLVHGTWHGGWCWQRVADALRAKGHKV